MPHLDPLAQTKGSSVILAVLIINPLEVGSGAGEKTCSLILCRRRRSLGTREGDTDSHGHVEECEGEEEVTQHVLEVRRTESKWLQWVSAPLLWEAAGFS